MFVSLRKCNASNGFMYILFVPVLKSSVSCRYTYADGIDYFNTSTVKQC